MFWTRNNSNTMIWVLFLRVVNVFTSMGLSDPDSQPFAKRRHQRLNLEGLGVMIFSLQISPSGCSGVMTSKSDGSNSFTNYLSVWDLTTGTCVKSFSIDNQNSIPVVVCTDSFSLLQLRGNKDVHLWDNNNESETHDLGNLLGSVAMHMAPHPTDPKLASVATACGKIHIIRYSSAPADQSRICSAEIIATLVVGGSLFEWQGCFCWLPDGKSLAWNHHRKICIVFFNAETQDLSYKPPENEVSKTFPLVQKANAFLQKEQPTSILEFQVSPDYTSVALRFAAVERKAFLKIISIKPLCQ
jgi:WD40 repeat protein